MTVVPWKDTADGQDGVDYAPRHRDAAGRYSVCRVRLGRTLNAAIKPFKREELGLVLMPLTTRASFVFAAAALCGGVEFPGEPVQAADWVPRVISHAAARLNTTAGCRVIETAAVVLRKETCEVLLVSCGAALSCCEFRRLFEELTGISRAFSTALHHPADVPACFSAAAGVFWWTEMRTFVN
jgi:hypothetical protein